MRKTAVARAPVTKHSLPMTRLLLILALAPLPALAQPRDELNVVRQVFAQIQPISTARNREYCGYLGFDGLGQLTTTAPVRGRKDECEPDAPDDFDIVASWHTHAGFDEGAYSEVPSVTDFEADEDEGIDGYLATPGGRLWYIDTTDGVVSQVCGLGCLFQDPDFVPGVEGRIERSYTYEDLLRREAE